MKDFKYYILFFMGILLMPSCLHEEEDVFGESAAERLNKAQKYYEDILTNASNGWVLEYIAGDTDANRRGAFNFLLKFEGGEVTASIDALAMSDVNPTSDNPYKKITSLYRFDQDMSVTLSFSSYNSFLHYYHEQHGSYTTYKGDFEFIIMEAYDDLIILHGKKYGNIMELHRMSDDITWEKYLENVNSIIDVCSVYSNFELMHNDQKVGTGSANSNYRYSFTLSESDATIASNALYTQTGIKFIDPLSINGLEVQNFDWDDVNKVYVCTDAGVNIKIVPVLDPSYLYYEQFIGTYSLSFTSGGSRTTTVTIEQKVNGKTLLLKGLIDFDIELVYDKMAGTASMLTQDLGMHDGYTVVLCPWSTTDGYLTWGAGCGMVSVLNQNKLDTDGIIEFRFVDNDKWISYKANAFLLYHFDSVSGSHASNTRKTSYIDSHTGSYQFYNFSAFTKQ